MGGRINLYLLGSIPAMILLLLVGMVYAQNIGQKAGGLVFNVSLGSSETLNWTVYNAATTPIQFSINLPGYNPIPYNATPTVVIFPMNGSLQPEQTLNLQVTVYMPSSDAVGLKWDGIAEIVASSPSISGGGAAIAGGLGKEIIILSAKPKFSWTPYLIAIVVIIAAAGIVLLVRNRRLKGRKVARRAELRRATRPLRAKGRARRSHTARSRRTARRTPAKRTARKARRSRRR